jgi:hypothetical protein
MSTSHHITYRQCVELLDVCQIDFDAKVWFLKFEDGKTFEIIKTPQVGTVHCLDHVVYLSGPITAEVCLVTGKYPGREEFRLQIVAGRHGGSSYTIDRVHISKIVARLKETK